MLRNMYQVIIRELSPLHADNFSNTGISQKNYATRDNKLI